MKTFQLLSLALVMSASTVFGQVQIDRSIDLNSGTPANARIMGIKQVSDKQDAVSAEAVQTGKLVYANAVSGANDIVLTFSPVPFTSLSLVAGTIVSFKAAAPNTGNVRLNVDGLGLTPLFKDVSVNLASGNIQTGQMVSALYDGTNFHLISRIADANSGGTVTSVSTAAANNGVTATWSMASPTPALTVGLGAITPSSVAATGTVTGSNLSGTNTGDQTLSGLGGVPASRTITINGTVQDLTANRTWSVGTGTQNFVAKWNNAGGTAIGNSLIFDNGTNVGIGNTSTTSRFEISTAALGTAINSVVEMLRLSGSNGNGSMLDVRHIRTAAGANWTFAGTRIQQKTDATWQGYMQFNGDGNDYGISFGTGGTTTAPGNVPERMKIASNGTVAISNLAGTGTRPVFADDNGVLKTSTVADWRLVIVDDFESNATGWVSNTTTTGTVTGAIVGRAQMTGGVSANNWILTSFVTSGGNNSVIKKGFDLTGIAHTEVMVRFTFYFIDSWDGETAWAGVSTAQTTAPDLVWYSGGYDYDGNATPYAISNGSAPGVGAAANMIGFSGFSDKQTVVQSYFRNSGNSIWLMVGTTGLGAPSNDESYGIDNVEIYVR